MPFLYVKEKRKEDCSMEKKRLGIWGWWQGNNLGDNWIKKTMSRIFPYAYFINTSVKDFREYDFIICGGGGLFIYDVIAPWGNIDKNIPYGMIGLGAEFHHNSLDAVKLCNNSKFFLVRDQYSLDCMNITNVERSYDITFALPLTTVSLDEINRKKVFFVWRDGHELIKNKNFENYIQPGSSYYEWYKIIESCFDTIIEDDFQTREDNIEERISDCGFVISGRYHGIVAAIQKGLPFIAIDICPKIRALLKECNLEEYCIKISEINEVNNLIKKACLDINKIRRKEKLFVEKANFVLKKQIEDVQLEILKVLKPLSIIHYGSYWMNENDVVNTMADDLGELCKLRKIDLKVYSKNPDKRIKINNITPNGKFCVLDDNKIIDDIEKNNADAIVLNSGGLCLSDCMFDEMNKRKITTVGISLSDPDVFPYNGKLYAEKFNLFYTNSKYALTNEYSKTNANAYLLPFAASRKHHFYMPEVERMYDIVIVGHARKDRIEIVENLNRICNVGTYGKGWENTLGIVNGMDHVKAINKGKMYLSFSKTMAGFNNVKVGLFEAIACNQVVITSYVEELQDYFDIGREILCYRSEEELYNLVKYYLKHEDELELIRKRGYIRFLNNHTYEKRWNDVIKKIYKIRGDI